MYLQHCDRFAKYMCIGRPAQCALPANGVYQELQCVNFESLEKRLVEDSLSSELSKVEEHFEARLHPSPRIG